MKKPGFCGKIFDLELEIYEETGFLAKPLRKS